VSFALNILSTMTLCSKSQLGGLAFGQEVFLVYSCHNEVNVRAFIFKVNDTGDATVSWTTEQLYSLLWISSVSSFRLPPTPVLPLKITSDYLSDEGAGTKVLKPGMISSLAMQRVSNVMPLLVL
jgi:hypothetical protein